MQGAAEAFLRARERFCVAASARFLGIKESRGHIWYLNNDEGEIIALLLHYRRSLFPVFDKNPNVPCPRFLNRFLGKISIHSIQGLETDNTILEKLIETQGSFVSERIDYDLMSIDDKPGPEALGAGPPGLILRPPAAGDEEQLFALQSAYEQEEVVPKNSVFNPQACRLNLKHILTREQVLVAEMDGQVVGKVNTSAASFTRHQIGGVYVHKDYRGRGIALKMTAVFVRNLLAQGRGVTLFVKKRNTAARRVYLKAGFSALDNYRISYY